ncbi:T9SS type A sorting domain-containing protein [Anaerophaga thermohalophila]|uniref:T9SS type A sorting domain-containing protein n=1 Tax=Anaerophaga thermohalophila TaxID=177400 RepID=UPI0003658D56|nr:T9SS type A sorting domain-containing protein [Anaerophaga thermohalophila]
MLNLNTGNDGWQVSEPLSEQIALSGGESLHIAYSGIEASDNNYIKINFSNPIDLHAFGQINMEFVPGGDFPGRMKIGLIDENGILNKNDLFVVSDFSFVDQNENILTYGYGKVDDGGEFLPCRISEIRIWMDSDEGNSGIVDFSISDIYFSELDFGSGIFNELHYESIRLWPNPVKEYVFFDQNNEWFDRWQIYNLTGKIVSAGILNNFQERIRLSGLSSGLYFLKLYNKQGNVRVGKFFVK